MKDHQPSRTAAYVAAYRGLTALLPPEARLCDDPFGVRFGGPIAEAVERASRHLPRPPLGLMRQMLWLQIRTRVLDDALLAFARGGGAQVLLLGAGFDCRAARFHRELEGAVVYEVDHPATQQRKREVLAGAGAASAPVRYMAWDFEREPMADLPARLAALGHDAGAPTLTIWEGVTMYLSEPVIAATVSAVGSLSAAGSLLALTYFDRARLDRPDLLGRVMSAAVAHLGEPFTFGWDPPALPGWLAARGFALVRDEDSRALAERLLPPSARRSQQRGLQHIALAERRG